MISRILSIFWAMAMVFTLITTASANLTVIGQGTITMAGGSGGGVGQTVDLVYSSLLDASILNFSNDSDTWSGQVNWTSNMMVDIDLNGDMTTDIPGVIGWRLPETYESRINMSGDIGWEGDPDGDGYYNYKYGHNMDLSSEMARLFYDELGNLGFWDTNGNYQSGNGLNNKGPLTALEETFYWSSTYSPSTSIAWYFAADEGYQGFIPKHKDISKGLAVLPNFGSQYVPNVPVPAAVWLLGSGLLGLIGIRRRAKKLLNCNS